MRWLATVLLLIAWPAHGQIRIVDGDTIVLGAVHYRLHGIDAPESHQSCPDGWPAGPIATAYLKSLMQGRAIHCEAKTTDRYGRTIALCTSDGWDLSADMVSAGMALAYTKYSLDYFTLETEAHDRKMGLHAHDCAAPWKWRKFHGRP